MKSWITITIMSIFPILLLGQEKIDSMKTLLSGNHHDTVKVNTMILIWESIAYSDPVEAHRIAFQAYRLSSKSGYKRGEAESLQRIAGGYTVRNINDSAQIYYEKSLKLYGELQDTRLEGVVLHNMAILFYNEGSYVQALLKTEESLKKASEVNDDHGVASSLQLLGNINHYLSNYEEAQKYLIQSQQVFEKLEDWIRYTDGLVYLATNYNARKKHDKALETLWEAIGRYRAMEDYIFLAQALNNTGFIYLQTENYDSAVFYFNQTITLTGNYENNAIQLLAMNNLGKVYLAKNDLPRSKMYYEEALTLAKNHNDRLRVAMIYRNLGDLMTRQLQYNSALVMYDSAEIAARQVGSKNSLKETYQSFATVWEKLGNQKKSLQYYKKYAALKDSIYDDQQVRKQEEMDARYEKVRKDKEIALQKSEIELLSKNLELQEIKQLVLIFGLILALVLGILIVLNLRQKMKQNRHIREQEKLLEAEKLKNTELQRDNFEMEVEYKNQELTAHALQIVQKNELLSTLKKNITYMEEHSDFDSRPGYRKLRTMINGSAQVDKEWENFNVHFEQVHQDFLARLKTNHPELTSNDLRLSAMLKLNLNSKEVAAVMNISPESVKKARYRLRKKLNLPEESDLHSFMMGV